MKNSRALRRNRAPRLLAFAALLAVTVAIGGCDSEPLRSADGGSACTYDGKEVASGSTFGAADGCNTCSCGADGVVACTQRACLDAGPDVPAIDAGGDASPFDVPPSCLDVSGNPIPCSAGDGGPQVDASADVAATCTYGGKTYADGATFPAADGCNTCSCSTAGMTCTTTACPLTDGGATMGGCRPGQDQTCNENPAISSLRGKCQPDGTCVCASGAPNPTTGRCPDPITGCEIHPGEVLPFGTTFTCADGCNYCHCSMGGTVDKTVIGCPDGGANACNLADAQYDFGWTGGLFAYSDRGWLLPGATGGDYLLTRAYASRGTGTTDVTATCWAPLPKCGDPAAIDIGDIIADLSDPTVQKVVSSTDPSSLVFGVDPRPIDGRIFSLRRGSGPELLIGAPCNGASGCVEIPPALAKLEQDLLELNQQQLVSPRCAAIVTGSFACGSTKCRTGSEYCARATVGGAEKIATCRPYPACSSCDCVSQDAVTVLGPVSDPACAATSSYKCFSDRGSPLSGSSTLVPLAILCAAP